MTTVRTASVSYTHLDVYKRQGIGSAQGADKAIEAVKLAVASPLLETKINGATPVSYTHLDVYKRQAYISVKILRHFCL